MTCALLGPSSRRGRGVSDGDLSLQGCDFVIAILLRTAVCHVESCLTPDQKIKTKKQQPRGFEGFGFSRQKEAVAGRGAEEEVDRKVNSSDKHQSSSANLQNSRQHEALLVRTKCRDSRAAQHAVFFPSLVCAECNYIIQSSTVGSFSHTSDVHG